MSMLGRPTEAELDKVRSAVLLLLDQDSYIYRWTKANDGYGQYTTTFVADLTVTPCRLTLATHRPSTDMDIIPKEGVRNTTFWVIRFPVDTVINAKDRVKINDNFYEILGTSEDRTWKTSLRCAAVKLD
jgi:hypothetical protein